MQLINFLGKQTVDEQLKSLATNDVLIAPELGDISAAKFDRSKDAIRIGEEATRAMADMLALQHPARAVRGAARDAGRRGEGRLGTVDEIRFEGLERTNPEVLRALVESKPGEPLIRGEDRRRPAPHLRPRRLREHRLPDRRRRPAGRVRW